MRTELSVCCTLDRGVVNQLAQDFNEGGGGPQVQKNFENSKKKQKTTFSSPRAEGDPGSKKTVRIHKKQIVSIPRRVPGPKKTKKKYFPAQGGEGDPGSNKNFENCQKTIMSYPRRVPGPKKLWEFSKKQKNRVSSPGGRRTPGPKKTSRILKNLLFPAPGGPQVQKNIENSKESKSQYFPAQWGGEKAPGRPRPKSGQF